MRAFLLLLCIVAIAYGQTTQRAGPTTTPQASPLPSDYVIVDKDRQNQPDSIYLQQPAGRYISIWHDIPIWADQANQLYNMVVEVPRGEQHQKDMRVDLPMNPLVDNSADANDPIDYIHNYGVLAQTFMNASETDETSGLLGNNQPLHVVEISDNVHRVGAVVRVKILGALGVKTNEGMIDYKLIGVDASSSLASEVQTLDDVEKVFPDLLGATRGFFRYYMYPQISDIAFNGKYQDAMTTSKIISDAHDSWDRLIHLPEQPAGFDIECHVEGATFQANDAQWTQIATSD